MAKLLSKNASILCYSYVARLVLFEERWISTRLELYRSQSPQMLRINDMYSFLIYNLFHFKVPVNLYSEIGKIRP
jgi:hypothetical protein